MKTKESQRDLLVSYNQLRRIAEKEGNLEEAEQWYKKGGEKVRGIVLDKLMYEK